MISLNLRSLDPVYFCNNLYLYIFVSTSLDVWNQYASDYPSYFKVAINQYTNG